MQEYLKRLGFERAAKYDNSDVRCMVKQFGTGYIPERYTFVRFLDDKRWIAGLRRKQMKALDKEGSGLSELKAVIEKWEKLKDHR